MHSNDDMYQGLPSSAERGICVVISKQYNSAQAVNLILDHPFAKQAYSEIEDAILKNHTEGFDHFVINCSEKNCNGMSKRAVQKQRGQKGLG